MCGICGFTQPDAPVNRDRFEAMVDMVDYRGPDGRGSFYEDSVGLALGHRRLAIVDLSPKAAQPFAYGDNLVICNGEIYNYIELRQQLQQLGYQFTTNSDTEVVAAAYSCWGPECTTRFNGMWSLCIYDRASNSLFCSRDRFGVKPFYYFIKDGTFAFASEIKQLLMWQQGLPRVNREALSRFIVLGEMDEGAETLFEGISQLLPGHQLTYHLGSRQWAITQWYQLPAPKEYTGSYTEACAQFEQAFTEAIQLRLRADVDVGSCLSGGLDSSAIVGVLHQLLEEQNSGGRQHTVSSCYNEKEFNEQEYIDAVVEKTGAVSHRIFPVLGEDKQWLDRLIWHMDEPVVSSSPYSQWCVFEEAARHKLKVMLDGQGADEQLAGYAQFYPIYFVELLRRGQLKAFRRELKDYKRLRSQYQPVSTLSIAGFSIISAFLPKALMKQVNRLIIRLRKPRLYRQPLWNKLLLASPQYALPSTRSYIEGAINGPLRLLLHLEDRNSMAHAIEARVPFMDVKLVESCWQMPFEYKIRHGVSKAVLRDGVRKYLPESVYQRQNKMGFPAPEANWVQQNADWFRNELEEACQRFPYLLNQSDVMEGFNAYLEKPQTGEFLWWRIMCANRWAKLFKVEV